MTRTQKQLKRVWREQQVTIIPITEIVPENWTHWFWGKIIENAPFSWGDNNRTLITPDRFIAHLEETLDFAGGDEKEMREFCEELDNEITIADICEWISRIEAIEAGKYIDLEN